MIFAISALIGILPYFIQRKIDVPDIKRSANQSEKLEDKIVKDNLLTSIKDIFNLLKNRKDFLIFQIGFTIGGFALMLISPAMNAFSNDILHLSYKSFMLAKLVIMGFGYIISSYFWNAALKKSSINFLTIFVLLGFSMYILSLVLSKFYLPFFFFAFFFYGIAQAGSTLFWKISPIIFSKNEDSLLFTITNLFFLGIRGLVAPLISFVLCVLFSETFVLFVGCLISFISMLYMIKNRIKSREPLQDIINE